ncbi:MAG: hypothetical protein V2I97_01475 [Desulfococcaceae bacterium]|nr:hypothetical protein [Desulfococcaceae bacterium]
MRLCGVLYPVPSGRSAEISPKLSARSVPEWEPVTCTNSTTVYAEVTIDGNPAADGDPVGVFADNGECRAVGQVFLLDDGRSCVSLLIQGESIETVNFKVYDAGRDINMIYFIYLKIN